MSLKLIVDGQSLRLEENFPLVVEKSKNYLTFEVEGIPEEATTKSAYFFQSWQSVKSPFLHIFRENYFTVPEYVTYTPDTEDRKYVDYYISVSISYIIDDVRVTTEPVTIKLEKTNYSNFTEEVPEIPPNQYENFVNDVKEAAEKVEELTPQVIDAANSAVDAAERAEAASEKAETKVESLIERNNKVAVSLWVGTQAEYDAITEKDEARLYLISDDNDLGDFANPYNLLDNSDFTNPVNQRGKTAYTEASGYTIDRWKKRGAPEESTVAVESGGIRIKRTSQNAYTGIFQIHKYRAAAFAGKTFTFAVKIKECGTRVGIRIIGSSNGDNNSYVADTIADKPGIYTVTATIPATYAETYIGVAIIPGMTSSTGVDGAAGDVVVEWAALYEGIYAADNIPAYKPKGYAAELAECRQYFVNYNRGAVCGFITGSATVFRCELPFAMRNTVTVTPYGSDFILRTVDGYAENAGGSTGATPTSVTALQGACSVKLDISWGDDLTLGDASVVNNRPAALETYGDSGFMFSADY